MLQTMVHIGFIPSWLLEHLLHSRLLVAITLSLQVAVVVVVALVAVEVLVVSELLLHNHLLLQPP